MTYKFADASNYEKAQAVQKAHNLVNAIEAKITMYEQMIDIADDDTVQVLIEKLQAVVRGLSIS